MAEASKGAPQLKVVCGRPPSAPKERLAPEGGKQGAAALYAQLKDRLRAYVLSNRLNQSEAREKILETIVTEARHFRPLDLVDRLRARHPEIGRATLYRNLPILVASGVLQEGPTDPTGQCFYELTDSEHHDHLVCLDCGKIFEFHDATIEKRQESISRALRFAPESHRHVIYARCEYAQKKSKG